MQKERLVRPRAGRLVILLFLVMALTPWGTWRAPLAVSANPDLTVEPTHGLPGDVVTVAGDGFPADVDGELFWDLDNSVLSAFRTDGEGRITLEFSIPAGAPGDYSVSAVIPGKSNGRNATASADITIDEPVASDTPVPPPSTETSVPPAATETPTRPPTDTPNGKPTEPPPTDTSTINPTEPSRTQTSTRTPTEVMFRVAGESMSLPIRATFYYPWFPNAWNQGGVYPYTNYMPSAGFYDGGDPTIISQQIAAMQYGGIQAGISSWWGQGHHTDKRLPALLSAASGTGFKWTVYHEAESLGDPSVSQITSDLKYLLANYASDPSYLRIDGKFVVFVYADASDACGMADRWSKANTVDAYIVLKVFSGYRNCAVQPQNWHQYAPSSAADAQAGYSYSISPGFWKKGEAPRLTRDLTRWGLNVRNMVASGAPFQLVVSFNEWGEGTSVESAKEWASASGHGSYLDVLHNNGMAVQPQPSNTPAPTQVAPTATPAPTKAPSGTPSSGEATSYRLVASGASANSAASTYVRDRNMSTIWKTKLFAAGPPASAWVWVDLGSKKPVGTIRWVFGEAGIGDYFEIHGSNNLQSWAYITKRNGKPVGVWQEKVLSTSYRYIRFRFQNPNRDKYLGGLAEVQVWSPGAAPPLPPPPTATAIATPSPTPAPSSTPAGGGNTLIAVGDIASCGSTGDEQTANLVAGMSGTVATLGDNVYEDGTSTEFRNCYDPSWGKLKSRTRPSTGNHDYHTAGATGYFGYFGAAAGNPATGYYSYNIGQWHIVALNSNCGKIGGCGLTSAQGQWLKADLAANPATCTLAYMHHPLFSSGDHGNNPNVKPLWDLLYNAGADVVLGGHDHSYERFSTQTPSGAYDQEFGIRAFVVGTGGKSLYAFGEIQPRSGVRYNGGHGVLRLVLNSGSYTWEFVSVPGKTFTDTGTGTCHGAPSASGAGLWATMSDSQGVGVASAAIMGDRRRLTSRTRSRRAVLVRTNYQD